MTPWFLPGYQQKPVSPNRVDLPPNDPLGHAKIGTSGAQMEQDGKVIYGCPLSIRLIHSAACIQGQTCSVMPDAEGSGAQNPKHGAGLSVWKEPIRCRRWSDPSRGLDRIRTHGQGAS